MLALPSGSDALIGRKEPRAALAFNCFFSPVACHLGRVALSSSSASSFSANSRQRRGREASAKVDDDAAAFYTASLLDARARRAKISPLASSLLADRRGLLTDVAVDNDDNAAAAAAVAAESFEF